MTAPSHLRPRLRRAAFTMTELLIVIGLIVLMIALAVPAFNLIRGSRSVDSAENQVAAMLGKARADAIGLQQPHGILFFIEPDSERVNIAEVYAADYPETGAPGRDVYLDLVANVDFLSLPPGVTAFAMIDAAMTAAAIPTRTTDGYLGYNNNYGGVTGSRACGGVILFNGDGQLISRTYGFRTELNGVATEMQTRLIGLPGADGFVEAGPVAIPAPGLSSAIGFALVDEELFKNHGGPDDPLINGTAYATSEFGEEQWLDDNSSQMIINRYNGTLTRAD